MTHGQECSVELRGQLFEGTYLRSVLFMRRMKVAADDEYFLAWVPAWRVFPKPTRRASIDYI